MSTPMRVCALCGKEYEGIGDTRYCPKCTAEQRKNVMRIRICQDCGREFLGGPRARRCADCAHNARNEASKRCRQNKSKNKKSVGSNGICEICGATFTRNSPRQKYCSPECARIGLLEYQRNRKKGDRKEPDNKIQRNVRNQRMKVCVYCGKQFWAKTAVQTCSAYCKKKQQILRKCQNELNVKQKRLNKLQAERDDYRKQVVADFQKT